MELSKEFMDDYRKLQLEVRVGKKEEDLNSIFLKDVEEYILKEEYVSGLILSIVTAKLLEKHGYSGNVISYMQGGNIFFAVIANENYILDAQRENMCIHYEKSHFMDKIRILDSFYQNGVIQFSSFVLSGVKKEEFALLGRPTKFTGTLGDFCFYPVRMQV